jgi:hypothetical protein
MVRADKKNGSTPRKAARRAARDVPLMVPHGGAESGRDFESAFELLQGDDRARELWHGERARILFAKAS